MTREQRNQLVELCRKAGMSNGAVAEIEGGCGVRRAARLIAAQLDDCRPGLLVLSDPDAAAEALELCASVA